jgi:hypothetical protein
MGITRQMLKWCDKTFMDSLEEPDERKAMRKASASGFVEGILDGAVIMYPVVLIACCVYKHKLDNK